LYPTVMNSKPEMAPAAPYASAVQTKLALDV
jgi:hypothetical protein